MELENLKIDTEKIQNQVRRELQAEEKYQRENSAKFRAIEQRVPTYEDFRQMVLASNLKPLDKGESMTELKSRNQIWNSAANGTQDQLYLEKRSETQAKENILDLKPKTNLEFMKVWRDLEKKGFDDKAKFGYLYNLSAESLLLIFKSEINGEILGKFLTLFEKQIKLIDSEDSECLLKVSFVLNCLKGFIKCNRFGLNIMFLNDSELKSCRNLIEIIHNLNETNDFNLLNIESDLNFIKKSYLN